MLDEKDVYSILQLFLAIPTVAYFTLAVISQSSELSKKLRIDPTTCMRWVAVLKLTVLLLILFYAAILSGYR